MEVSFQLASAQLSVLQEIMGTLRRRRQTSTKDPKWSWLESRKWPSCIQTWTWITTIHSSTHLDRVLVHLGQGHSGLNGGLLKERCLFQDLLEELSYHFLFPECGTCRCLHGARSRHRHVWMIKGSRRRDNKDVGGKWSLRR